MSTKSIAVLFTILLVAGVSAYADIVPPIRWDVETGRLEPRPYSLSIRRGESITIEPRFTSYTVPIVVSNATIEMRYSAAYDSVSYYSAAGAVLTDTGRVQIAWNDSLNPTNASMVYEIRATVGTNVLARAYGPLIFLGGMVGINTGLTARTSLDWATVHQANGYAVLSNQMGSGATWSGSQWMFAGGSGSDTNAWHIGDPVTNATDETARAGLLGKQPTGTYVTAESDPVWQAQSSTVWGAISGKQATGDYATVTALGGYVSTGAVGTAAYSNSGDFATSNQGALADSALQANITASADNTPYAALTLRNSAEPASLYSYSLAIGFATAVDGTLGGTNYLAWEADGTAINSGYFVRYYGAGVSHKIYDAGNFLAGTHYLAPNGSGSSLTGITASQVGASPTGHLHDATAITNAPWLTNVTTAAIVAAGGVTNVYNDPVLTSSNLLGFAGTTCTITRAMGNALNLTPTGTVYFAADATLTDTNVVAGFTLDLFYNDQTFGFVGASMTNTATLTSNAWNSIIFWKGRGSSVFVGK
jgi:hypothetical protein